MDNYCLPQLICFFIYLSATHDIPDTAECMMELTDTFGQIYTGWTTGGNYNAKQAQRGVASFVWEDIFVVASLRCSLSKISASESWERDIDGC